MPRSGFDGPVDGRLVVRCHSVELNHGIARGALGVRFLSVYGRDRLARTFWLHDVCGRQRPRLTAEPVVIDCETLPKSATA